MRALAGSLLMCSLIALGSAAARAQDGGRSPVAGVDPWTGRYRGDELRLELRPGAGGYEGTVALGDRTFPLRAALQGDRLVGSFESDGHAFPVTVRRAGAGLELETDGTRYALAREAPRNPLERVGGPPAAGGAGEGAAPQGWVEYRHQVGFAFRHPPGWQVHEAQGGLALVPPDLARDAQGQPLELFFVQGVPAQGVTRPDDPRAVDYADAQVRGLFPFLARQGGAQPAPSPGGRPGVALSWSGRNPLGRPIVARLYLTILGDHAVLLWAVGEEPRVTAREPLLRGVFDSFERGAGQRDARLVGVWRRESHTTTRDFSSTSIRTLVLAGDGSCRSGGQYLASSTTRDQGGNPTGGANLDSGEGAGSVGTWSADGRRLLLSWNDGTFEDYQYEVTGGNMLLQAGGKSSLYDRVR